MASPTTTTTPDFTGVVDQRFFLAPLGGPQHPVNYLDRFPEELYNKALDSHLVRFLYTLLGPAGVGWLRKNYLDARLKLEDFGIELTDLDKFYGDPIKFGRILEELYEEDPSGVLSPEVWEKLRVKDARYRNRALDYVGGARAGGTPLGMHLVARSGLGHEVEIFERYRYLYDQVTDDKIGIPNNGFTKSTEEMVVIPRRELPQSEVQVLTISGSPTGGSFTLTFPIGDTVLNTTQAINYNADRAAIQLLLEALPSIGKGNVSVSGGPLPNEPVQILFTGDLAYSDVPKLTADTGSLTGGTAVTFAITTVKSGIDQMDETVAIPAKDKYYLIQALSRIKPVTSIVTFAKGSGKTSRQNWSQALSSSVRHEVTRYVTGQSGISWPSDDQTQWIEKAVEKRAPRSSGIVHSYQGFHNVASVSAYTEDAIADPSYGTSTSILDNYRNEHIGNYTNYQVALYPILGYSNPGSQYFADKSVADYAEPLTVGGTTADSNNPTALINGIYPSSYRNLSGVPQVKYKDEQFWSSVERTQGDDYLEIDLGTAQAVNYIYFEATLKPYDIEVSYDLLDQAPARTWKTVKLVNGLPSVTRLDYSVASRNPWKTVELWFTNSLDRMVYTRFIRIKLSRRIQDDSPFTNFDGSLEQFSIEVKNLRVGRNVT